MASDSERRKIFFEAPRGPLKSHISGSKKPSAGVEVGQ